MKQKLLSLALAFIMALALIPSSALAAGEEFVVENSMLVEYNGSGGDVVIPGNLGITAISTSAFQKNRDIRSVVIPEGVLVLGGDQPSSFYNFTEIMDGDGNGTGVYRRGSYSYTVSIANGAFWGCTNLVSVTFPKTLQIIREHAFDGCSSLTTVNMPDFLVTPDIGSYMFRGCTALKSMTVPQNTNFVTYSTVPMAMFSECTSLESVTLPDNLYEIEGYSFEGCKNLKSITIPDGTVRISSAAFKDCTALTSISLPDSVKEIGSSAFEGCTSLRDVSFSPSTTVGQDAFTDTPWMEAQKEQQGDFVVVNGVLSAYNGPGGDVVIPGDLGITAIAGFAPSDGSAPPSITSITIPEGVERIETKAFYSDYEDLKKVTLPSNLKMVGSSSFAYCDALTEVEWPEHDGEVYLGNMAFYKCSALEEFPLTDDMIIDSKSTFEDTPFLTRALEEAKAEGGDFVMLGSTLVEYRGSGGNVVLPDNFLRFEWNNDGYHVFEGREDIISVTFPQRMTDRLKAIKKTDALADEYLNQFEYLNFGSLFAGCSGLLEVRGLSEDVCSAATMNDLKRFNSNVDYYLGWVDPAKHVEPQSQAIISQSNAIVKSAGAVSNYDKAKAIADWVAKNIKYDINVSNGGSTVGVPIYPEEVLSARVTICDGYARLTSALLQAQGIPSIYVTGLGGSGFVSFPVSHAWTEAYIDGRWVIIDTTWMAPISDSATGAQGYDPYYFDMNLVDFSNYPGREEGNITYPNSWHQITSRPVDNSVPVSTPSTQTVNVDGKNVTFSMYALGGGSTNYIRARDLAAILNGTEAQFEVGWNGNVTLTSGTGYTGSTDKAPFRTNMPYTNYTAPTYVNGQAVELEAIQITHEGGGYTYYKLRDLGQALGFNVGWSADKGVFIETDKPYNPND